MTRPTAYFIIRESKVYVYGYTYLLLNSLGEKIGRDHSIWDTMHNADESLFVSWEDEGTRYVLELLTRVKSRIKFRIVKRFFIFAF